MGAGATPEERIDNSLGSRSRSGGIVIQARSYRHRMRALPQEDTREDELSGRYLGSHTVLQSTLRTLPLSSRKPKTTLHMCLSA